jgi:CRP/FNR family transcriptional regulator, cyclic AMP receptor protein
MIVMDKSLLSGLLGPDGRQLLIDALKAQGIVGDENLARQLAKCVKVEEVPSGTVIITRGTSAHELIFILSGEFLVSVGDQVIARRMGGDHVGEMAVVDPEATRSATVTACSDAIVARISEPDFSAVADRFPQLWRRIAKELADRIRRATRPPRHGTGPTDCVA